VARFPYDWQTLAAGLFALLAAVGTIRETRSTARKQIDTSGEDARKVIAATHDLTEATFKQSEATIHLEQQRKASEALAFHAMLKAAMARVLAQAALAQRGLSAAFFEGEHRRSCQCPYIRRRGQHRSASGRIGRPRRHLHLARYPRSRHEEVAV
jgi:hypothetical protein